MYLRSIDDDMYFLFGKSFFEIMLDVSSSLSPSLKSDGWSLFLSLVGMIFFHRLGIDSSKTVRLFRDDGFLQLISGLF
jgi:hypothetical protein